MSAETACYSALTAAAPVTAIVGEPPSDRIYSDFVPQEKVLPAIAFTRMETAPIFTIHSSTVLASRCQLELWCMGINRSATEALAAVVLTALAIDNFSLSDKRAHIDFDNGIYSTILTFTVWE